MVALKMYLGEEETVSLDTDEPGGTCLTSSGLIDVRVG